MVERVGGVPPRTRLLRRPDRTWIVRDLIPDAFRGDGGTSAEARCARGRSAAAARGNRVPSGVTGVRRASGRPWDLLACPASRPSWPRDTLAPLGPVHARAGGLGTPVSGHSTGRFAPGGGCDPPPMSPKKTAVPPAVRASAPRRGLLRAEIRRHDLVYYNEGRSEISDAEYDALFRELKALEEEHPELAHGRQPDPEGGGTAPGGWQLREGPARGLRCCRSRASAPRTRPGTSRPRSTVSSGLEEGRSSSGTWSRSSTASRRRSSTWTAS